MNKSPMTRSQQSERRNNVYTYFKGVINSSSQLKKEDIYIKIAEVFGYANVNSVKAIVSDLKKEEAENNKIALNYAKGIVDSVMFFQEHIVPEVSLEDLDIKYDLSVAQNMQNTIIIEGNFNSDFSLNNEGSRKYTRTLLFEHFSSTNIGEAITRLSNLFQECHKAFLENTKNK